MECIDAYTDTLSVLKEECEPHLIKYTVSKKPEEQLYAVSSFKPESLVTLFEKVKSSIGVEALEPIRKVMILQSLLANWDDLLSEKYPNSIQQQFMKSARRFLGMCQSQDGWMCHSDDVYWKDLAIARQKVFPAGAQIVEAYSGFGLMQGLSLNPLQVLSFLKLITHCGGRTGYYQIHTHVPDLDQFNNQGWIDCFLRIAAMLRVNKHIKGLFGGSWFYDPQLVGVSPHLTYLQSIPMDNGAFRFYLGRDRTGNAFSTSKKRVDLYNEGKYTPKSYLMVWPRDALIRWAANQ
ncbi:hypothetical protein [Desulfoluna butyratoxydans]|uniref:Uncharacterized protein n=1 Tax=Desulfoluna butyratoxydans TaxID=231438 RepID=A0A4U8YKF9_9BACT|nr:hypothetical protein [Desulfoluna butyratoxydans]VFQ44345.1 hypothetical protein MSL71_19920 [Desulfoluna butyratoxydans]